MNTLHIPEHIAIIMDGNGRWAQKRGLPRTAGHKQGAENIRKIAIACSHMGVKALTVYAFSTENWKRPTTEINYLCKLPKLFFNRYLKELMKNNIRVVSLGEIDKFPMETQTVIDSAVTKTASNTGMRLCLAVNYGSQREIVLATTHYVEDRMKNPDLAPLDEAMFARYLMTAELPEVDLMIRTGGELRISNFLLWQIAYAELIFTDVAWPDFDEQQLHQCIEEFNKRNRRFGGLAS